MQLRGGSSKGAYFLASDLPAQALERDDLLLRILGSPDERQIDGIGGGHPLSSKVAVVSPSPDPGADVDYLFLQVVPDRPIVTDAQTCGNLLAGVAPFAIERGLVPATRAETTVRVRLMNPVVSFAYAVVQTPGGRVRYEGSATMAGAPFAAAPVLLSFPGDGRPVFPTGRTVDECAGFRVTCVDAGMPVVLIPAADLGVTGAESPAELEADATLRPKVEAIRLAAGLLMGLGDVTDTTVPKVCLLSPSSTGTVATRTFIPHRVHTAIGVLGAVSVAAGVVAEGTVAHVAVDGPLLGIEHPTGVLDVTIHLSGTGGEVGLLDSGVVRTARKLADGTVWPRTHQEER